MAEILLSLTIIGIVAAITLPALTGNINERTWESKKKALYSRISQALNLMPTVRGYSDTESYVAELGKIIKMNSVCYKENLAQCNFPKKFWGIKHLQSNTLENIDDIAKLWEDSYGATKWQNTFQHAPTNAVGVETINGDSLLVYYNPYCKDFYSGNHYHIQHLCVNIIYDLNGPKGPNEFNKDIGFISVIYPTRNTAIVSPYFVLNKNNSLASDHGNKYTACAFHKNARIATGEEHFALQANRGVTLHRVPNNNYSCVATISVSDYRNRRFTICDMNMWEGGDWDDTRSAYFYCVKSR